MGPLKKNNSQTLTESDKETAEVLQSFFKSVFTEENRNDVPEFPEQLNYDQAISDVDITQEQVFEKLKSLNPDKAPGPDGISTMVLKTCAVQLVVPLCILFNKTLRGGQLPKDWKNAIITPIFKKGTRSEACNYRPVLLPRCAKLWNIY